MPSLDPPQRPDERHWQPVVRVTPDRDRWRPLWRCVLACGCVRYLHGQLYLMAPSRVPCHTHPYQ